MLLIDFYFSVVKLLVAVQKSNMGVSSLSVSQTYIVPV